MAESLSAVTKEIEWMEWWTTLLIDHKANMFSKELALYRVAVVMASVGSHHRRGGRRGQLDCLP